MTILSASGIISIMKFIDRFRGQPDEFQGLRDRERMLRGLKNLHAVHLALRDLEAQSTPLDEAIAASPDIIDIRNRHPEYQEGRGLTVDEINPEDYLNRQFEQPSHVRIVPKEELQARTDQSEIG